jgi:hypothetical protein
VLIKKEKIIKFYHYFWVCFLFLYRLCFVFRIVPNSSIYQDIVSSFIDTVVFLGLIYRFLALRKLMKTEYPYRYIEIKSHLICFFVVESLGMFFQLFINLLLLIYNYTPLIFIDHRHIHLLEEYI